MITNLPQLLLIYYGTHFLTLKKKKKKNWSQSVVSAFSKFHSWEVFINFDFFNPKFFHGEDLILFTCFLLSPWVVSDSLWPHELAWQDPLSMGFTRQEYCSVLPFPSPGDLPNPGIKPTSPVSPALQVDSLSAEPSGKPIRTILYRNLRNSRIFWIRKALNSKGGDSLWWL